MSSVLQVPDGDNAALAARDAWKTVHTHGIVQLVSRCLCRFRYGDGFSHSRALGLQLALAAVPLIVAAVGLSGTLSAPAARQVLRETMLALTPGASQDLVRRTLSPLADNRDTNLWALVLGLGFAVFSLATALGQTERGANRIYGVQRDRPTAQKYGRAALIAGVAGLPAMAGSVLLIVADPFSDAVENAYGIDDDVAALWTRPLGMLLVLGAVAIMLRHSPHRRQPGKALLAVGVVVALASWTVLTAGLAAFLHVSSQVGSVYGPLTGVMALLVWAQLTAAALFLGFAVSAELEMAAHAARGDRWRHPDPSIEESEVRLPEPDADDRSPAPPLEEAAFNRNVPTTRHASHRATRPRQEGEGPQSRRRDRSAAQPASAS